MTRWSSLVCAILPLLASACDELAPPPEDAWTGVWEQRGYARVYAIDGQDVVSYDVTAVSCVPSGTMTLDDLLTAHDRIEQTPEAYSWYEVGQFTRYEFDRRADLPAACQEAPRTDPEATFEALWNLFDENYAFFAERNVDWQAAYDANRGRVNANLPPEELLGVFQEMLVPLDDGHVWVFDGVSLGFLGGSFGALWDQWAAGYAGEPVDNPANPRGVFIEQMMVHVDQEILGGAGRNDLFGAMRWGMLEDGIGYLDVHTFAPQTDLEFDGEQVLAHVDAAMGSMLEDLAGARVLIVDARFNEGGLDSIGYAIAGHFVHQDVLVSRKYAVHGEATTAVQDVHVVPRGTRKFDGPIVFMQGPNSVSAAETFAIAMNALPQVTSVGEATYGSLSDSLVRVLPNGWLVSLSNETYEAHDGAVYEALGVPAEIEVPYDSSIAFEDNLRRVLDEAKKVARASIH